MNDRITLLANWDEFWLKSWREILIVLRYTRFIFQSVSLITVVTVLWLKQTISWLQKKYTHTNVCNDSERTWKLMDEWKNYSEFINKHVIHYHISPFPYRLVMVSATTVKLVVWRSFFVVSHCSSTWNFLAYPVFLLWLVGRRIWWSSQSLEH